MNTDAQLPADGATPAELMAQPDLMAQAILEVAAVRGMGAPVHEEGSDFGRKEAEQWLIVMARIPRELLGQLTEQTRKIVDAIRFDDAFRKVCAALEVDPEQVTEEQRLPLVAGCPNDVLLTLPEHVQGVALELREPRQ